MENFIYYSELYNIYKCLFTDKQKSILELYYNDLFRVNATPELLKELKVKYLLSGTELESLNTEEITFENIYYWNGFYIYRLDY